MIDPLVIEGVTTAESADISKLITKLDLSWTMDAVSQMKIEFHDPGLKLFKANYFQRRRGITYKNVVFEIASFEISQGPGSAGKITVEARRRPIQQMKRDKEAKAFTGASASDFIKTVATKFGMGFFGQTTAAKRIVMQASNSTTKESVWDAVSRVAGDEKSVVFESDGNMYFGTQEWLIGKWGNITLTYPSPTDDPYPLMEIPTCRASEDDITVAEFSAVIMRKNAVNLRPGMTVKLSGLNDFDLSYLITEVSYTEGDGTPVSISARTPEKPEVK